MIVIGCDIGSLFTKAVMLKDDDLVASKIIPTTGKLEQELDHLLKELARDAGISLSQVHCLASTGNGARLVPSADLVEDTVTCLAASSAFYLSEVELAIDIGGQSITSVLLNSEGEMVDFMKNDKCASGSGRFLEVMSEKLKVQLNELDSLSARANKPLGFSTQCGVFAESELISYLNLGEEVSNIVAGICSAVANLVVAQARKFSSVNHYTITGGVAQIHSVVKNIKEKLTGAFHPFPFPAQLATALGAAVLASSE